MADSKVLRYWIYIFLIKSLPANNAQEVSAGPAINVIGKSVEFNLATRRLVIDTDAGVDDALGIMVAVGYEHIHGGVDVIAITCVNGNTNVVNVVDNVLKTLKTLDRLDIPVYSGATTALHVPRATDGIFGSDGFGDIEFQNPPPARKHLQKKHAVIALVDIVSQYPGEVTILCLGPLTNIALAIRLDPKFLSKVRNLVVMGASVEGYGNVLPGIEFNFYADPEAAFIVFNSTDTRVTNVKPIILVPWETAMNRNTIGIDWRMNVLGALGSPQVQLMNKIEASHLKGTTWVSIDALATAITLASSIVEAFTEQYLQVEVFGEHAGASFVDYQKSLERPHNVIIVQQVNVTCYQNLLIKCLESETRVRVIP